MKNLQSEINDGYSLDIYSVSVGPLGYGYKRIVITLSYNGVTKEFEAATSNMQGFDEAMDLEVLERNEALLNLIYDCIMWDVFEWIEHVQNLSSEN